MFNFTKQERHVLAFFGLILLVGGIMEYAFKKNPQLHNMVNLIDSKVYYKIDPNSATMDDLVRLPYIGEKTAQRIIEGRKKNGGFVDIQEIKDLPGVRKENYEIFSRYLTIRPQ